MLSIWNASNAFSVRECIDNLDSARHQLALRVVLHFAEYGDSRELSEIGYKVSQACPRLYDLGQRAWDAKRQLREEWRDADARDEQESDE